MAVSSIQVVIFRLCVGLSFAGVIIAGVGTLLSLGALILKFHQSEAVEGLWFFVEYLAISGVALLVFRALLWAVKPLKRPMV